MPDRLQRRDGQGRHLFPDDGEEAPARAGNRAAEQPALHLPGGLGRSEPADAGRSFPRPRALRAHLLQPGQSLGVGHTADRRGDGFVHRGRRLCAGDERRDHHGAQPGDDLPGRPAAGQGRDRRDRDRRGTGRRGRAHPAIGGRRSLCAERRARAGHRPADCGQPESRQGAAGRAARAARTVVRSARALWRDSHGHPQALRRARGDRAHRRR